MQTNANFQSGLSLLDNEQLYRKIQYNQRRNAEQDHSQLIDNAVSQFSYAACKDEYWNPESFSLLHNTPLWEQASQRQKTILNHLYWVAYYAQIVSAEIATIFLNQVSSAGLYTIENFRVVCDSLDLESKQERAHIHAFKTIGEEVEQQLFGERIFTYPMRSLYEQTMIFNDSNKIKDFWRSLQIKAYILMASSRAFMASQYLLIRGLRTLNGKLVQHQLSRYYSQHPEKDKAPIPAAISYYHFMDESFHFNSSKIIGHEVPLCLHKPNGLEFLLVNKAVTGCQRDHFHFSAAVKGIFWYEPALFPMIYKILISPTFNMEKKEALTMMEQCFTQENQGIIDAYDMHNTARHSYQSYVETISYLNKTNRAMSLMGNNSIHAYLSTNRKAFNRFKRNYEI